MEKLKDRWNIESNFQIFIIFIVFAVNGSLSVMLVESIMSVIEISKDFTNPIIFWSVRILLMFIIYQILLMIIGTLFGHHKFFWNMEKKMLSRIGFKKFMIESL